MLAPLTPMVVNMLCTPMFHYINYLITQLPWIVNHEFTVVDIHNSHAPPMPMPRAVANTSHAHACHCVGGTGDGRVCIVARTCDPTLGRLSDMMQRNRHHHQQVAVLQIRYTAIISAWCWSGKSVTQLCAIEQCTPHVVVICMAIHQYVNIALITIYGNYMCKPMIEPLSPPLPPSLHDGHLCHVLIREHHRSVNRDH